MPTQDERNDALTDLVNSLDKYQIRHLQALLQAKTFQSDIIASLPLEIVAQIFENLDVLDPYRLQIVSKAWFHVLRSPYVLKPLLTKWYGHHVIGPDLEGLRAYDLCQTKAEQICRLRCGKPYGRVNLLSWEMWKFGGPDLIGDNLVWIKGRKICVWNLHTGKHRRLATEARQDIDEFALSENLIAFRASNACYAQLLNPDQLRKKKLRLPNAEHVQQMHCSGPFIALSGVGNTAIYVTIWDFNANTTQSFEVPSNRYPFSSGNDHLKPGHPIKLLVDSRSRLVHLMIADDMRFNSPAYDNADKGSSIRYATFTFAGEQIYSAVQHYPNYPGIWLGRMRLAGHSGKHALEVQIKTQQESNSCTWVTIEIDPQASPMIIPQELQNPLGRQQMLFWWNDAYFKDDGADYTPIDRIEFTFQRNSVLMNDRWTVRVRVDHANLSFWTLDIGAYDKYFSPRPRGVQTFLEEFGGFEFDHSDWEAVLEANAIGPVKLEH